MKTRKYVLYFYFLTLTPFSLALASSTLDQLKRELDPLLIEKRNLLLEKNKIEDDYRHEMEILTEQVRAKIESEYAKESDKSKTYQSLGQDIHRKSMNVLDRQKEGLKVYADFIERFIDNYQSGPAEILRQIEDLNQMTTEQAVEKRAFIRERLSNLLDLERQKFSSISFDKGMIFGEMVNFYAPYSEVIDKNKDFVEKIMKAPLISLSKSTDTLDKTKQYNEKRFIELHDLLRISMVRIDQLTSATHEKRISEEIQKFFGELENVQTSTEFVKKVNEVLLESNRQSRDSLAQKGIPLLTPKYLLAQKILVFESFCQSPDHLVGDQRPYKAGCALIRDEIREAEYFMEEELEGLFLKNLRKIRRTSGGDLEDQLQVIEEFLRNKDFESALSLMDEISNTINAKDNVTIQVPWNNMVRAS